MLAIQPLTLPAATQMLLALDPGAEPQTGAGFEAQFSAALAGTIQTAAPTLLANAPPKPTLPATRGRKDEPANSELGGNLGGKQSGNILPDGLAAQPAPLTQRDPAAVSPETLPERGPIDAPPEPLAVALPEALPFAAPDVARVDGASITRRTPQIAQASPSRRAAMAETPPAFVAKTPLASKQHATTPVPTPPPPTNATSGAPLATRFAETHTLKIQDAANPAASAAIPPEARQSLWLAQASTAPASSSTLMPQAPQNALIAAGLAGEAAPAEPAIPARTAAVSVLPADPAPATIARPQLRIPLTLALPAAHAPRQTSAEGIVPVTADEVVAAAVKSVAAAPAMLPPAMLQVLQSAGEAKAAPQILVQHGIKPADPAAPPAPLEATVAQPFASPEAIATSPQQALAMPTALPTTAQPAIAPQPHDFAALIDRLVDARQAVQATLSSQTVQTTVQHAEFGKVSLAFQQDAAGMTVSFANPDPDLARAVQSMAPVTSGDSAMRQDWQGGAQNQPQQGQLPAQQQQRGQSTQRAPDAAPTNRNAGLDHDTSSPSARRDGIFA